MVNSLYIRYYYQLERGKCLELWNELIFSKFDEHLHALWFDKMDKLGLSSFVACANNSEVLYKAIFENHGFNDKSLFYCTEWVKYILKYKISGHIPSMHSVTKIPMEPFPYFYQLDLTLCGERLKAATTNK